MPTLTKRCARVWWTREAHGEKGVPLDAATLFGPQPEKAEEVQQFLTVAEAQVKTRYPFSAKFYLKTQLGAPLDTRYSGGCAAALE